MRLRAQPMRGARVQSMPVSGQRKALWRRRLQRTGLILFLLITGGAVHRFSDYLLDPAQFPVRHVYLQGELRHIDVTQVREMVAEYLGENFFTLDIDALHEDLAAHPWVDQVMIWRQWPDTVKVRLRERIAFAYWNGNALVDINATVFQPSVFEHTGSWPRLAGPAGHEFAVMEAYQQASALLDQVDLRLVRLRLDERRAWWMTLNTGTEIRLGREHFIERLRRFIDIYPQAFADRMEEIAAVDLRYSNGFAVRWKTDPSVTRSSQTTGRTDLCCGAHPPAG